MRTDRFVYRRDASGVLIAHPDRDLVLKKTDPSALPQVSARAGRPTAIGLVHLVAMAATAAAGFFIAHAWVRRLRAPAACADLERKLDARAAELREALGYQTAITDVLRVISTSPFDVAPVFEAILVSASRLFDDPLAAVFRYDGQLVHLVATRNWTVEAIEDARRLYPGPPNPQMMSGRVIMSGQVQHQEDALRDPTYDRQAAGIGHWRRMLGAPLMKDGSPIGAIVVAWPEPGPTSQRQAELFKTFADQAVIAIENVRLLNETKEALAQQTATSEILKVISGSPTDVQPVLDAVGERSRLLCRAEGSRVWLLDGDQLRAMTSHGGAEGADPQLNRLALSRTSIGGRAFLERRCVHVEDVVPLIDKEYPDVEELQARYGFRTVLAVPMLWEGASIGVISLFRYEVRPFSAAEINLIQTFADQAVIAIQNARLFQEIQDKSRLLEVANQHKSEFLANMSHELRTPLNAIIGFSEVLIERMFGELNPKQDDYLQDIHSSGRHLLSLINDILDLSKIEAGRMELDVGTFDAGAALGNAMTLVRERAQRHGIALGLDLDAGMGELRADERMFKQILVNLLSNAVKFTPDGGHVHLHARWVDGALEVTVRDTGIGIAPCDQQAVFEEFRQVGGHYATKQEGTGLGLALTKRFVELHGGTISLQSVPGKGSTFTFTIPGQT